MNNILITANNTLVSNDMALKDVLTLIISILALAISTITCLSNLNEKRRKNLPNLKILSIINERNISNPQNGHCRIQHGNSLIDASMGGKIFTYKSDDCEDKAYIKEIQNNKNKVYFTYFNLKPHLVINHANDSDNFFVDHSDVKITFHNYGAKISALSILKFQVFYNDITNHKSSLTLKGDKNNKITITPEENDSFELYLDEVTTDLQCSMCNLTKPEYYANSSSLTIDLLKTHLSKDIFAYKKIEITAICWDVNNKPIKYLITIEHNGNFFTSSTILLDRHKLYI